MPAAVKEETNVEEDHDDQTAGTQRNTRTVRCETCGKDLSGTPGELGELIHTLHIGHEMTGI